MLCFPYHRLTSHSRHSEIFVLKMLSVQDFGVQRHNDTPCLPTIRFLTRPFYIRQSPSPIQSTPVEIMSRIFTLASASSHDDHDSFLHPITISHVCRHWRHISLSTSSLWTTIHLSLPLSKSQLMRTIAWLLRSRNRPLDIYLDFRDPSWDWDEETHPFGWKAMENVMRLLVPQSSRWRSIELLTDTWAPIFTFLSYTVRINSAPFLESIRLSRCNEYFATQGQEFQPANLSFPVPWFAGGAALSNVRHLSLSGVHVDWSACGFTCLKELEFKYHAQQVMPTLLEFQGILHANPGIERLTILGWGPQIDHISFNDSQIIKLPHLKELEFGFMEVDYAIDLLSMFSAPQLQVLTIEDVAFGMHLTERLDCTRLLDRLVGISESDSPCIPLPSLRRLTLRGIQASNASLQNFLRCLRSVGSLCLDNIEAAPLLALCSAFDGCPRLSLLTLKDLGPMAISLLLSSNSLPRNLRTLIDMDESDPQEDDLAASDI